jgi:hypothetical protein
VPRSRRAERRDPLACPGKIGIALCWLVAWDRGGSAPLACSSAASGNSREENQGRACVDPRWLVFRTRPQPQLPLEWEITMRRESGPESDYTRTWSPSGEIEYAALADGTEERLKALRAPSSAERGFKG